MLPSRVTLAMRLLGVLLWSLALPASAAGAPPAPPSGTPFPPQLLHTQESTYSVVLYHPTAPPENLVAEARKLLAEQYKVLSTPSKAGAPQAQVEVRSLPPEDIERVPEKLLYFFARRLDADERHQLMSARHATKLIFHVPFAQRDEALLAATRFAHQLATQTHAFLWDDETREYFSPQRWKEERLEGWTGGPPSMPAHVTMHVYGDGETVRFVTLGMVKLGLPDLVVETVPRSMTMPMGTVINGIAQLLVEGEQIGPENFVDVDFSRLKDARTRRQIDGKSAPKAFHRWKMIALEARRDRGDPDNPLLELAFPGSGSLHERQLAALDGLLGKRPDALTPVPPNDPELAEVARKARARLQELRPRLAKGMGPPESLVVKAGFRTDDNNTEHMWFDVSSIDTKDKLHGTLANEPFGVKSLRLGSSVTVPLSDVDDYRYTHADGTQEGGESSRILEQRQEGH